MLQYISMLHLLIVVGVQGLQSARLNILFRLFLLFLEFTKCEDLSYSRDGFSLYRGWTVLPLSFSLLVVIHFTEFTEPYQCISMTGWYLAIKDILVLIYMCSKYPPKIVFKQHIAGIGWFTLGIPVKMTVFGHCCHPSQWKFIVDL